jgi:hypothetical protein
MPQFFHLDFASRPAVSLYRGARGLQVVPHRLSSSFPFLNSIFSNYITDLVLHATTSSKMKAFSTLLISLAGFASVYIALPADAGSTSVPLHFQTVVERSPPQSTNKCIDPHHPPTTPPSGAPTPIKERSLTECDSPWPTWDGDRRVERSAPTPAPSSGERPVEHFGYFIDVPHSSRPQNITVPKGVCQKADEGKGVPEWANFVEVFMEHWCDFYS